MADVVKTIGGTTPDYATFTLFDAAIPADISLATGTDEHWIGKGRDVLFSEDVGISGITTDATNRVTLTYDTGAKHDGRSRTISGSGCSIANGNIQGTIRIAIAHCTIDGLDVATTVLGPAIGLFNAQPVGNEIIIKDSIVRGPSTSYTEAAIDVVTASTAINLNVYNTVTYSGGRGLDSRNASNVNVDYCTFFSHNNNLIIVGSSELTCRNVYAGKASGAAEDFWTGGASPSGSNNISSDTTATVDYTSSLINKAAANQFNNITIGSEDFRLKTGADCDGAAIVIAGITTDIIGTSRDGSTPDVGAFELVTAAGGFQSAWARNSNALINGSM